MISLLVLLCFIIGGYGYITDSGRVQAMAESYLSGLVGGPVKVGGATLSVFEGLRLDDVRVYVDDQTEAPDSLLFSAQTFLIKYDPRTMLTGRLEATQIVAQKPQVHLAENWDLGEWNYERLARKRRQAVHPASAMPGRPTALPEVLLRNARVTISEIRGGQEVARGLMAVDGRLTTTGDPDRFAFHLQSRGVNEGIGPYASGSVSLSSGNVVARLMNFQFDRDIRSMLPAEPREWWQRHELAGAVSMPEISFTPGKRDKAEQFKIKTDLNGVTLSVSPEEWMSRSDVRRLQSMRRSVDMVGGLYRYASPKSNPASRMAELLTPPKITLKNVAGTFVFTNAGIEVKDVSGFVESNALKIDGQIHGYRPDAPFSLQVASSDIENINIPAAPRYINSLPREVREVYEQFKPQGECRLAIKLERPQPDARPAVSGSVQVLDARFVFHRFPYPLRNVTGRIDFGRSADGTGRMSMNLRGNGIATGPNRDAIFEIKTFGDAVAPLGTNICGVNVRITGTNVASEDALRDAFPADVRQALTNFDAHRTGKYPQFRGDFVTEVVRPVGSRQRWTFDTDITLTDGSGALVAFPYPLHDLAGKLLIRSGYAELVDMRMQRDPGGGSLAVNGRVAWSSPENRPDSQPPYRARGSQLSPRAKGSVLTDLKVSVRSLPIDNELLGAIPKEQREWVRKLGISGKLDVDGRIFPSKATENGAKVEWVVGGQPEAAKLVDAAAQDVTPPISTERRGAQPGFAYDLKLAVREGTMRPFGGAFDATGVTAVLHLTPDRLGIENVTGRRGDAELTAKGNIDWPHGRARVVLDGSATALALDDALYNLLPGPARQAWDETSPEGTVDAEVHYDSNPIAVEPTAPKPAGLRVTLKPRQLATTLKSVPYRLEELTGAIFVEDNRVTITDVTGRHDDAKVILAGTGVLGASSVWDLRIGGESLPVDDELRQALPTALAAVIQGLKLEGTVGFNLTRFVYRGAEGAVEKSADAPAAEPEIDVAGSFTLAGGKLDVGVPLTDVVGVAKMDATVREGHLETLRGGIDFDSMKMAGRAAKDFRAELFKPAGRSELRISKMRGDIADGAMSGDMTLVYPDDGPSRYSLELVVRDADIRALAWEKEDATVKGRLTASLSLEGSWNDASQRRGRGDVIVAGRDMYRIPLVLGLLQVTNLSLPVSSPFNEATAVYSLDGTRVIFEQIQLKARNMLMEGNGSLDFDTKRVDLAFTTDSPGGLMKLPFLKELWSGARNEMLKIHVRGTVQAPEVSAQSMGTFWTTVDEVFDAGKKSEPSDKKRRSR